MFLEGALSKGIDFSLSQWLIFGLPARRASSSERFSPNEPYGLPPAFVKALNISHATTTGLESAGEKQLNPTVPELIENLSFLTSIRFSRKRHNIPVRTLSLLSDGGPFSHPDSQSP